MFNVFFPRWFILSFHLNDILFRFDGNSKCEEINVKLCSWKFWIISKFAKTFISINWLVSMESKRLPAKLLSCGASKYHMIEVDHGSRGKISRFGSAAASRPVTSCAVLRAELLVFRELVLVLVIVRYNRIFAINWLWEKLRCSKQILSSTKNISLSH